MFRHPLLPILILILLLASFARVHHLTQQSLWLDEGYTHQVVTRLGPIGAAADDMHPPLYYIALWGWLALAGDSVLSMRYLSALLSILTVPLVYRLARQLAPTQASNSRTGVAVLATLLFAISDPDIFMAQEIRNYAFFTLMLVLNALLYLRWTARPSRGRTAAWAPSTLGLIYTHYLSAVMLIAQGLHALFFLRRRLRWQALGWLGLNVLLFLPWLAGPLQEQLRSPNPLFMPWSLNAETLHMLLVEYFSQQWALVIGLALLGLVRIIHSRESGEAQYRLDWQPQGPAVMLAVWVGLPFAILFVVNLFRPFLSPRWPLLITPALAMLVARGLGNLRQPARGLLLAALLLYGITTVDFYQPKPPWDQVAANMVRYARPGDVALMEVNNGDFSLGYYLEHWMPPGTTIRSLLRWREQANPTAYPIEVARLLESHPSVWLATWGEDHDIFGQLASLGYVQTMVLTTDHVGNALNVYRYDRLPQEPLARFTSGMVLRDARLYAHPLRVDLWWSAPQPLAIDYSVSAFLLDEAGRLVAQRDSYPFADARPTTSWQPGEVVYDPRPLAPEDLPPGRYTVGVKVYTWYDGTIFPTVDGEEWVAVGTIER